MNIAQTFLTNLFNTVAGIWWVIPILLIVLLLKSPRVKGMLGEKMVQTRAALKLDSNIYHPFNNLILPSNGATTQLDHVYVSPYGIFVVETKNVQGWIFGGENQANWRQVIYHKKTHFQNPLRQNYRHIKALSALLGQLENIFHSVVVFTHPDYTFKTAMPRNVCDLSQFDLYIRSFQQKVLSENEVQRICQILSQERFAGTRARSKQHIQSLNQRN